jgi:hypothetical protein
MEYQTNEAEVVDVDANGIRSGNTDNRCRPMLLGHRASDKVHRHPICRATSTRATFIPPA